MGETKDVESATKTVLVDDIPFPQNITTVTTEKQLPLLGQGITDMEIHFLQIKFTAIGVYLEPEIASHLQQWKGKTGAELSQDDEFFAAVVSASVEKYVRVVVIKEIKGSQYMLQLESWVRDELAAADKYEDEEEESLDKVIEFFQSKYLKQHSVITFHFSATTPAVAEIGLEIEGQKDLKIKVENGNVIEMIQKWYLGGTRGVSPSTTQSLATSLGEILLQ
ncbi:hypothetical protein C5167_024780 [Papaver somniferum]|uniref:Chalcone-flavonone isomerase family protein n=1 Tax=Papaver somniferum TaxID=3469 RepID=A0A4Y7JPH4_PAPSO|nr:probable chalcone--flavonone isomerase 3 [Papaver somniferum]XP_026388794.1 probable chalcone--flavonone isomerase 3 [Papaver somniferum]XP_026388795.1 probable chalcone--flavonone isomerase 3 [Papaver somniferum]RZC63001.1 hypothetical protein C5167_024781 [Papaver somniferum]RZC63003.1 hypothetical protein C5167_024779 [Papaver somniferum]RZC63005.1 hypothetical protein C5167_024780 [Papaver somniferum]